MQDIVFIKDLELPASIGITDQELKEKQHIIINIRMTMNRDGAWKSDDINETVCYASICDQVKTILNSQHFNLVETLAERIAAKCLKKNIVQSVSVEINKPDILEECAGVGVQIIRP